MDIDQSLLDFASDKPKNSGSPKPAPKPKPAPGLDSVSQPAQDIPPIPAPWASIEAKPEFKALTTEKQQEAKAAYFDYFIAPRAGDQAQTLRQQFLAQPIKQPSMTEQVVSGVQRAGKAVGDYISGNRSVMDGYTPPAQPQALPPVTPDQRAAVEAAWDSGTPEKRAELEARQDWAGQLARSRAQQYAAFDANATRTTRNLDTRVEGRRQALIGRGEDPRFAEVAAQQGARRGVMPGREVADLQRTTGTVGASDFDFDTAKAFAETPGLANPLTRGLVKGGIGATKALVGVSEAMWDALGAEQPVKNAGRIGNVLRGKEAAIGERGAFLERNLEGAISSIAQQLPLLIGGAVTGSLALPLAGMAVQSFGQEYSDGKSAGQTPAQASLRASAYAALEVIGERFGLKEQIAALKGVATGMPADQIFKFFARALSKEVPGELLTTTGQFAVDKFGPAGIGLNPEGTMEQYLKQVADTIAQTIMQSGIMAGGTSGASTAVRFLNERGYGERIAEADANDARSRAIQAWENTFQPSNQAPKEPANERQRQEAAPTQEVLTSPTAGAPTAPAGTPSVSDDDAVGFAQSRLQQLIAKRDGTMETIMGTNGPEDIEVPGVELTPAEVQELETLQRADGDPKTIRQLYGFDTTEQGQENVTETPEAQQAEEEGPQAPTPPDVAPETPAEPQAPTAPTPPDVTPETPPADQGQETAPPPAPKTSGEFATAAEAANYIGQQRRNSGTRLPAALPLPYPDGTFGIVTEGKEGWDAAVAFDKANNPKTEKESKKNDNRVWNDTRVPGLRHDTTTSPVRTWRYGDKEFAGTELLPEYPQFYNKTLVDSLPDDVVQDAQKMIRTRLEWYDKEFGIIGSETTPFAPLYPPAVEASRFDQATKPDDFDAMFDEVLAEEVAKDGAAKPKTEKAARARKQKPQGPRIYNEDGSYYNAPAPKTEKEARTKRTATQATASAAKNTAKALNNAIDGLGELFGGKGRLSSGLTFDEETYAKAKPLFQQAIANLKDAQSDLREAMRTVIRMVLDKFGADAAQNMKPYVVRFIEETASQEQNTQQEATADASTVQTDAVPPGDTGADQTDVTAGNRDSEPVGPGVAGDGQGADQGRPVPDNTDGAGETGARGAESDGNEPSGETRDSAGVGAESQPASDFVIDAGEIGKGGLTKKYRDNVAAIRILKALDAEGRVATPEERKQLSKYVGWGALKGPFDPDNKQWAKQHAELKELLTDEEFKAARRSTLDAHYTSPVAVGAMFDAMARLGFTGGRLLEPSVGSGNFFGLMPAEMRKASQLHGVELDSLTSRLVSALYPEAKIAKSTGFEDFQIPSEYFDAVIGNPPFGSQPLVDAERSPYSGFSIHNYFLAKSIDKLRPGGIMQVIVSHNFLDAQDGRARKWIGERASLIGAVRLPNTAFKKNAGTEVVTDILIFQKNGADGSSSGNLADWQDVVDQTNTNPKTGDAVKHKVNQLFAGRPDLVLGTPSAGGSMYSANEYTVEATQDIKEGLAKWVESLPKNVYIPIAREKNLESTDMAVPDGVKVGSYYIDATGMVKQRGEDVLGEKTAIEWTAPNEKALARMKGMIELRDTLRTQMRLERSPDSPVADIEANRTKLNALYDDFLKKHGYLNSQVNRRLFLDDTEAQLVQALEFDYDKGVSATTAEKEGIDQRDPSATKADILKRRVAFPPQDFMTVTTAKDALLASLNYRGRVDIAYMQEVYGKSKDEIVKELGDVVFNDPQMGIVTADEYLSGDVKTKLAEAQAAVQSDKAFQRNVDALEKIIPKDKNPSDISVSIGAAWVPAKVYEDFVQHITGGGATAVYVKATGQWLMSFAASSDPSLNSGKFGTSEINAQDLFQLSMLGRGAVIRKTMRNSDGGTTTVVLEKETELAREKQNAIAAEWKKWIWQDPARTDMLVSIYNDKMNRIVERKFDGEHLTFPGMNPAITLLQHQKNGVWRGLQSFQVLYDHVVGAGKTFEMATLAMEMRRLGIARKPLFVVPNHLTLQWRSEFTRLYPGSNILAATPEDFAKGNRERLFSKIVTGDWDAVVIGHSSLKKIGLPEDTERSVLQEQIDEVSEAIEEMKRARGDRNIVRDMEKIRSTITAKMKDKMAAIGKRDKVVTFDELGIDAMFVDEMHEFKNLAYNTTMDRNPGMGNPAGSAKAFDMFVKVRWLFDTFGAKTPFITATGTPVSNSLVEMFNFQRYMQYPTLKAQGLHVFDSWAKQFGSVENVYEVAPSGSGYRQSTRFAKFNNLPALMSLYNTFADTITLDDLRAQEEAQGKRFPVPKIVGGRPVLVVAKRSPQVAEFMGVPKAETDEFGNVAFGVDLSKDIVIEKDEKSGKYGIRVDGIGIGGQFETEQEAKLKLVELSVTPRVTVDPNSILGRFANLRQLTRETKGKVNALSLTGEANKAGLDFRLINPAAKDFAGSKINLAIDNMMKIYQQWAADKGTQLVFCDMSIPLSARASYSSKPRRLYVRDDSGAIDMKRGTMHTLQGHEDLPYFVVQRGDKDTKRFDVYDAASGLKLTSDYRSKVDAIERTNAILADEENRQKLIDATRGREIQSEEIDEYNNENDVETDGVEYFSREDIAGMSGATKFSVYDDIKAKLMAKGVPEHEIAFVHDYATPTAKDKLFKAVNSGEIRFLLGSTPKMGAGTNVQKRLVGLHHIDAPWRPSDLEQREGRIIRRGNALYERDPEGFEVFIGRYATEQTYDTRRWQILEHKARGIEQLRNYDGTTNEIDDIDGEAANAADMKAAASGDPLILEETKLRNEVRRLEQLQAGHADEVLSMRRKAKAAQEYADTTGPKEASEIKDLIATIEKNPLDKDGWSPLTIDGKQYADKDQALKASVFAVANLMDDRADEVVVKYRGVEFMLEASTGGVLKSMRMIPPVGFSSHWTAEDTFSASGFLQRLKNYADSLPGYLNSIEKNIEKSAKNAILMRNQAEQPFAQSADLDRAREAHKKVQRALMAKGPNVPEQQKPLVEKGVQDQRAKLKRLGYGDALKEFFSTPTDDGFFSIGAATGKGMTVQQVNAAVSKVHASWKNAPGFVVLESMDDPRTPPAIRRKLESMRRAGAVGVPGGFIHNGKIYLVANGLANPRDAVRVLVHEVIGHWGLAKTFGKGLVKVLDQIIASRPQLVAKKIAKYGLDPNSRQDMLEAAEEVLVEMAETRPDLGVVRRATAAIAEWLRNNVPAFKDLKLTDSEIIREFIMPARRYVERGDGMRPIGDVQMEQGRLAMEGRDRQTDTPEFRRWFGDSKVVDENGEPLVVYHGSAVNRTEFRRDRAGGLSGAFFTSNKAEARDYAEMDADDGGKARVISAYLSLQNPYRSTDFNEFQVLTQKRRDELEAQGYDGMIGEYPGGAKEFIAFSPTQIKSATGNIGTFDPNNPDIRFSLNDEKPFTETVRSIQNNLIQFFGNRNKTPSAQTFGLYDRTLATQYHKALKDRSFGRVFGLVNAMQNHVSLASIRPAELAPGVLPKVDDVRSALSTVVRGRGSQRDLAEASKAIFAGTLAGDNVMQGKVWSEQELREVFNLSDTGVALYKQTREAIDASIDELAAAEAYAMVQSIVPGAMRRQVIDNPQQAESLIMGELAKQLNMLELAMKTAKAGGNEQQIALLSQSVNDFLQTRRNVEKIFTTAKNLKVSGYAPLMRFGKYTLTVRAIDPETGNIVRDENNEAVIDYYGQFETEAEADLMQTRLAKMYEDRDDIEIRKGVKSQTAHELYAGVSPETIAMFSEAVGADTTMRKYYEMALSERSALKRRLERKGTAGFNEDLPRVLSNFITSNARFASQRLYLRSINGSIKSIPKERGDVLDEAQELKKFVLDPNDSGAAVSSLMFTWFLGGSVAAAMVNLSQPVMMTMPYLSQYGFARANKAVLSAIPQAMGGKEITNKDLREGLRKASQEGIVDAQEIFHLYSLGAQSVAANLAGALAKIPGAGDRVKAAGDDTRARINAFLTLWGSMFSVAERFNRKLTFIAAWNVAVDRGLKDPYAFAVRAVNETQGIYNKINRPKWARHPVGRTLLIFKQYSIMYVELISRMVKRGGPEGKRAALVMLAVLLLLSGEEGLPFMQDLNDLIDTIGQMLGYDTNTVRNKRRLAYEILGKELGDMFLYGVSSKLPLDFSGRLGLGNMIPGTGILKPSNENLRGRELAEIVGPTAGMAGQIADAYDAFVEGNSGKSVQNLMPKAVKDVVAAGEMLDKGYATDARGRKVTDVTGADAVTKAVGFNPTRLAEQTRKTMPVQQDIALQRRTESSIVDLWARGIVDKDAEMVATAEKRLSEWNRKNPNTPIALRPGQIRDKVRALSTERDARVIKQAPREMRGRVAGGLEDVE